jgi:hypothetical protein
MQGGFVEAQGAVTIAIPFDGQNIPGGGREKDFERLGHDLNEDEWSLAFRLQQDNLIYTLGSIGMAHDAHAGFDRYDASTPPRFFDYLEMNFNGPEHFAKRFTRDIVQTQQNYTWNFAVDSNIAGMADLTWDNNSLKQSVKEIFLLDVSTQILINMKDIGRYSFNPVESANFRLFFGDNLTITPEKVQLGKAYPNPTSGNTQIAFSLPDSGGPGQYITLDIVDVTGKKVGTIANGRYTPGYHEVSWDATQLNNGFYNYRLTVEGSKGKTTIVNKLIIK